MSWARFDDNIADHPKISGAGHLAELAFYRSILYANRCLTDGYIAKAVLPTLCRGFEKQSRVIATTLLRARLWDRVAGDPGRYRIHNYLFYQASRAHIESVRETRRKLGKIGGLAKANGRSEANTNLANS